MTKRPPWEYPAVSARLDAHRRARTRKCANGMFEGLAARYEGGRRVALGGAIRDTRARALRAAEKAAR